MNITLPKSEMDRLRKKPNKSRFVAEAVREKLDAEENARKAAELAEAYRESGRADREITDEWDGVSGDAL